MEGWRRWKAVRRGTTGRRWKAGKRWKAFRSWSEGWRLKARIINAGGDRTLLEGGIQVGGGRKAGGGRREMW